MPLQWDKLQVPYRCLFDENKFIKCLLDACPNEKTCWIAFAIKRKKSLYQKMNYSALQSPQQCALFGKLSQTGCPDSIVVWSNILIRFGISFSLPTFNFDSFVVQIVFLFCLMNFIVLWTQCILIQFWTWLCTLLTVFLLCPELMSPVHYFSNSTVFPISSFWNWLYIQVFLSWYSEKQILPEGCIFDTCITLDEFPKVNGGASCRAFGGIVIISPLAL